uniref:Variable length PCR target protein n=2 Tax=Ehrlichia chaffeensis TaxID=945 RepID=Q6W7H6_EHRCH|nr:variable length PCR target protein [Ehrlichia chaffeensis]
MSQFSEDNMGNIQMPFDSDSHEPSHLELPSLSEEVIQLESDLQQSSNSDLHGSFSVELFDPSKEEVQLESDLPPSSNSDLHESSFVELPGPSKEEVQFEDDAKNVVYGQDHVSLSELGLLLGGVFSTMNYLSGYTPYYYHHYCCYNPYYYFDYVTPDYCHHCSESSLE